MLRQALFLVLAVGYLTGCGVASVSPVVTDADRVAEPRLVGTWQDSGGREFAVITAVANDFRVAYTDNDGKTGQFNARFGSLGGHRILDLEPFDPLPNANDVYKSLVLRAHGVVLIDSVGVSLHFRILQADSLREYLKKNPMAVPHAMIGNTVLLTAPTPELRRFLNEFLSRPGVMGEAEVWRRRRP